MTFVPPRKNFLNHLNQNWFQVEKENVLERLLSVFQRLEKFVKSSLVHPQFGPHFSLSSLVVGCA